MDARITALFAWLIVIGPAIAQDLSKNKSFGERQVEQMLDDRPDMKDVIGSGDFIYKWLVSSFDGGATQNRVYWNASVPTNGFPACHYPRWSLYPAQICITDDPKLNGIEKWFAAVFEHFNLDNEVEQRKLIAKVFRQQITIEQFADRFVDLERVAEKKTIAFLEERLPENHPLRSCEYVLSSEHAKNRRPNAKWDYGPNRADYIEFYRSFSLPAAN